MNKREVIATVAERSGINPDECRIVLDTFENVFAEEISSSKWKEAVFGHVYDILTNIRNKQNKQRIA